MTKRIMTVVLVLGLSLVFLLASCKAKDSQTQTETAVAEQTVAEEKPVETEAATTVAEETTTETVQAEEPAAEPATEEVQTEATTETSAEDSGVELRMPETLVEKFSYAFGVLCASNYGVDNAMQYFYMYKAYQLPELDEYFGALGVYSVSQSMLLYSVDDLNGFLSEYPAEYQARIAEQSAENLAKAEAFLAENAKKEGVYTTESGLQYEIITQGTGALATSTDRVELDYELKLLNGEVIDSSYARGEHSVFGMNEVIPGFSEGVMLMPMGSHYIFYIHPDLGYGTRVMGSEGPNAVLIFEVETYSISE